MHPRLKDIPDGHERAVFFVGQEVQPADLVHGPAHLLHMARRHNRLLHGWGIVQGLEVEAVKDDKAPKNEKWFAVKPGYLLTPLGDEIHVVKRALVEVTREYTDGSLPNKDDHAGCGEARSAPESKKRDGTLLLIIEATEEASHFKVAGKGTCGTRDRCEPTRQRDAYRLRLLKPDGPNKRDPYPAEGSLAGPKEKQDFVVLAGFTFPLPDAPTPDLGVAELYRDRPAQFRSG